MSRLHHPSRYSAHAVLAAALLASIAWSQTAVSAFGPIPGTEIDKVAEGSEAKISSTLRQAATTVRATIAARGTGAHVEALSVPKLWQVNDRGAVQVYLWLTDLTEVERTVLERMGVEIQSMEPTMMKAVLTWLEPDAIDRIAALDIVKVISLPDYTRSNSGSVTTQGDAILRANAARVRGFDGKNVKVGVISDGANNRNTAAVSGDLPQTSPGSGVAAVQMNPAIPGSGDEGTAMLEIVHDLAPGATLAFSGAPTSVDFVNAVNWCANTANCHVICDDLIIFAEPFFQDGAAALTCEAAIANGHTYVTSAGNYRQNHVQYPYSGVTFTPSFAGVPWSLHNWQFGDHSLDIQVAASATPTTVTVFLQWNEVYGSATANYDLYIVNAAETAVVAQSTNAQGAGYIFPFEATALSLPPSAVNQTFRIWIRKTDPGAPTKTFEMFLHQTGGTPVVSLLTEYQLAFDCIVGHAASANVISCAAVGQSSGAPWCTTEYFSSIGPSTIWFPTPANRITPTLGAIDGVSVTGAGGFSNPFYGTSAASPHVAGVAALLKSAKPTATPTQISTLLIQGAVDCGLPGYDYAIGYGRVDAFASIGLACPGAGFECQPAACTYAFPVGLTAVGDCEGSSVNGSAGLAIDSVPNGAGFPTEGNQYARIWGSAVGGGNRLFLKLAPMTLTWDIYNAEAPSSGFNDGMAIDVVAADGSTVVANLAYADTNTPYGTSQDSGGCSSGFYDVLAPGPQRVTVNAIAGGAYVRITVWNGGDDLYASMGCVDIDPAPRIDYFSAGSQTIGFTLSNGPTFGTYFAAISLAQGATPNGWFYGLDIPLSQLWSELGTGLPFWGPLDRNGGYTFGPVCCVPSGTPIYSVAVFMNGAGLGSPIASSPVAIHVVP